MLPRNYFQTLIRYRGTHFAKSDLKNVRLDFLVFHYISLLQCAWHLLFVLHPWDKCWDQRILFCANEIRLYHGTRSSVSLSYVISHALNFVINWFSGHKIRIFHISFYLYSIPFMTWVTLILFCQINLTFCITRYCDHRIWLCDIVKLRSVCCNTGSFSFGHFIWFSGHHLFLILWS